MEAGLKTGIQNLGNGVVNTLRGDRTGATVVANTHWQFHESALNGKIMYASNAITWVAPWTTFSTTPPLILWNPPASGVNLSLTKVSVGYVSGTLGAGNIAIGAVASQVTVPTTGTEITPICSAIGFPRGAGRVFTGSTLAATPTIVRPVFNMGAFVGTTAILPQDCDVLIDGSVIVTPWSAICLQGIAGAGTSPLVILAFTYEETPTLN